MLNLNQWIPTLDRGCLSFVGVARLTVVGPTPTLVTRPEMWQPQRTLSPTGHHVDSFGGTRGARRGRGLGGSLRSRAFHAEFINTNRTPMDDSPIVPDPPIVIPCAGAVALDASPYPSVKACGSVRGGA